MRVRVVGVGWTTILSNSQEYHDTRALASTSAVCVAVAARAASSAARAASFACTAAATRSTYAGTRIASCSSASDASAFDATRWRTNTHTVKNMRCRGVRVHNTCKRVNSARNRVVVAVSEASGIATAQRPRIRLKQNCQPPHPNSPRQLSPALTTKHPEACGSPP